MTLLTENNGWAIVWMNERYYLRHLSCGSFLRNKYAVNGGCFCKRGNRVSPVAISTMVDELILNKFKLLTKGDK